jgi:hypothetical protein
MYFQWFAPGAAPPTAAKIIIIKADSMEERQQ